MSAENEGIGESAELSAVDGVVDNSGLSHICVCKNAEISYHTAKGGICAYNGNLRSKSYVESSRKSLSAILFCGERKQTYPLTAEDLNILSAGAEGAVVKNES